MRHPSLVRRSTKPMLCALAATVLPTGAAVAQSDGVAGIAERELIRRQSAIQEAHEAVAQGDKLSAERDYEGAIAEYRRALDLYPKAPVVQAQRSAAIAKYADSSVRLAKQRAQNGDYDASRGLLNSVLSPEVAPDHGDAKKLLTDLDDPDIYNPANSADHMDKVQKVEKLLELAIGQYELGNYDDARGTLNQVLTLDRYNTAARRKLETIERKISSHHKSSRDHTRANMLRMVDELWETYVPDASLSQFTSDETGEADGAALTMEKLRQIRIPNINFDQASIQEAVDFLRLKSKELDINTSDPTQKGVNIIIRDTATSGIGEDAGTPVASRRITLALSDVPLQEALKYVSDLAGLRYRVEPYAVIVVPATDTGDELFTRTFKVPPTFLTNADGGDGGGDVAADPFADPGAGDTGSGLTVKKSAKDILGAAGITFPEGATAYFDKTTSRLIIRNTPNNIDLVAQFVEDLRVKGQTQIYITTKFVEVTQTNNDELGFDWLLGPFNISSSNRTFGSGGTVGNAASGAIDLQNFPFVDPATSLPVGVNPITRGLRFGSNAITDDAIDGLIREQDAVVSGVTPGIFALSGVFTDPQFQMVIRGLAQKKGVDLMSAPSVVTRSGQRAKIEVIREFIYPTEFDPPEIPQDFGSITGTGGFNPFTGTTQSSISSFPVTPTTPTAFETRNTGVTLEVDPVIGPDGFTIDLNLAPEVVEFEGFVNYGSPISTGATNALGLPTTIVLTENKIEQPVFSTRKASTAVTIWDGQTVAIGGLIREDVQSVEDSVPVLGDLPIVGRLFKTKADNHFKRNLMIFVKAQLIDPAGQPIRPTSKSTDSGSNDNALLPPPPLGG